MLKSRWRILGVFVGALALVGAAFAIWIRAVADRRWAEMAADVQAMRREMLARPSERPVLQGEPEPGNAWDEYERALAEVGRINGWDTLFLRVFECRDPMVDRTAVESLVAAHQTALIHLRRGARRAISDRDPMKDVEESHRLVTLAVCQARLMMDQGRERDAMDLLLDLAQFGRDLAHRAPFPSRSSGHYVGKTSCDELQGLVISGRLTRDDLSDLERGLVILDGSLPITGPMEQADLLDMAIHRLKSKDLHSELRHHSGFSFLAAWRYGFSDRLVVVDAFRRGIEFSKRSDAVRDSSWNEARQVGNEIRDQAVEAGFFFAPFRVFGGIMQWDHEDRRGRARVRLLRIGARYQATGEILELDDPFGAKMVHERNGSRLKAWSVDGDGVDNRGYIGAPLSDHLERDLAIEVDR